MSKFERFVGTPKAGPYYTWEKAKRTLMNCKYCGVEFKGLSHSRFCSTPHRQAWYRENKK